MFVYFFNIHKQNYFIKRSMFKNNEPTNLWKNLYKENPPL